LIAHFWQINLLMDHWQ